MKTYCRGETGPCCVKAFRGRKIDMQRRQMCLILIGSLVGSASFYHPGDALATTAQGYKTTLLAKGLFGEMDVSSLLPQGMKADEKDRLQLSIQQTKGPLDVYVQSNVWAPGGSTGWHSHPGPSLIIVTAGTVTDYEGHDPDCRPHVYKAGTGFVDSGGDHVHILRNEGTVEAQTTAVQFIPEGRDRRIDVADPGNCHF